MWTQVESNLVELTLAESNMNTINRKSLLIALGFVLSAAAQAETPVNQADAAAAKAVIPAPYTPAMPYNYAYPGPVYGAPYYPQNRQAFSNRNSQRFNGRNNWYGNNRMEHMNRAVSDMISDMFGDTAGDFEFDMKIKFKAKGKGKGKAAGRGQGYSDSRMQQRYNGDYRGNYQGTGNYYGGGNAYQYQGYRGYGYPAYAPATPANPAPTMNNAFPPQPASKSQAESNNIKAK